MILNGDEEQIKQVIWNLCINALEAMSQGTPALKINKIYDPFYSSKKNGVGLGLATVYQFVNRNGGIMDFKSTAGKGTLFTVFLPDQDGVKPVPMSSH